MRPDYDVAIAGGGPAGLCLALALSGSGHRVLLIEAAAAAAADQRGLALAPASTRILAGLGVWDAIRPQATPIRKLHVSEAGRFGCVRLDASEFGLEALGHVVPAAELVRLLAQAVSACGNVTVLRPARVTGILQEHGVSSFDVEGGVTQRLHSRLLVAADGTRSALRDLLGIAATEYDYGQSAIVTTVTPVRDHEGTAFERFSPAGPTALLPQADGRCTAILGVPAGRAAAHLAMNDEEFLETLDQRSGRRLGGFCAVAARAAWPLRRVLAERQLQGRVLLLGNAAHTLHPNAAQGLNLALRDIAGLAELLVTAPDPGADGLLQAYVAARLPDQRRVAGFTHGIARLFYTDQCLPAALRRAAMLLSERMPPLRRALLRHGSGLAGRQPRSVRGAMPA